MTRERILEILSEILSNLAIQNPKFELRVEKLTFDTLLEDAGINEDTVRILGQELKYRFGGFTINVELLYNMQQHFKDTPMDMNTYKTIDHLVTHISASIHHEVPNPVVVYVDDEEENLFIFRRKFGKRFNLKTFENPLEALEYIRTDSNVVLVLTDEMMPAMTGTELCDAAKRTRPFLKFIMVTGNPAGDADLMKTSLSRHRFYEFINKPLDLVNRENEYFEMINEVVSGNYF